MGFLPDDADAIGGSIAQRCPDGIAPPSAKSRRREPVRIIVVGSDPAITNVIFTLFVKEFAEIYEWSDPMPEPNTGKMMRVMTKYVNLD